MRLRIPALLLSGLLLLAPSPRPAHAIGLCDWSEPEAQSAARFYMLLAVDIAQTHYFLDHGGEEQNPLLGDHPSHTVVNLAGLAGAALFTGVSCRLSGDDRRHWHGLANFAEAVAVVVNTVAILLQRRRNQPAARAASVPVFRLRF